MKENRLNDADDTFESIRGQGGCIQAVSEEGAFPKEFYKLREKLNETFSEKLLRMIDKRKLKDSVVYKAARIDRRHFSKIRSDKNYNPNKNTVLALAIALSLGCEETEYLLDAAGFSLSHSRLFDVIVEFFITNGIYDIDKINKGLSEYGEDSLIE